ncbi:unnamed protein product [Ostreobium quekettii]|uniref:Uncharacterized protein n=1 Tax=Ostreobium quekettii TaxID=121088 RepID=A0A8S1IVI7_9CHLO|nr:unnamed protein product [Ostreobium quekettii]|eukprot:evm.model.scf_804.4 EVM.evm.TU.scf_804.4   scf_804:36290-36793(-)
MGARPSRAQAGPAALTVKKARFFGRDRDVRDASGVVGRILFSRDFATATVVVRGERYEVFRLHLRLKKGGEEVMSSVEAKGVYSKLTTDYMGRRYVMEYISSGWVVRCGVQEVGRLSRRWLRFGEGVPLLLQVHLLWYTLLPDVALAVRALDITRMYAGARKIGYCN